MHNDIWSIAISLIFRTATASVGENETTETITENGQSEISANRPISQHIVSTEVCNVLFFTYN